MVNALSWFEIAVTDIARATEFYETVMGTALTPMQMSPTHPMAAFDNMNGGGCLIQGEGYTPSTEGVVIYLKCEPDLQPMLDRVEEAGGKVLLSKTSIGGNGWMAYILDSEGNKIGLHSNE